MKKIVLASASPRRKELLETAGIEFEISIADVDESIPEGIKPEDAAKMTAEKKALAVVGTVNGLYYENKRERGKGTRLLGWLRP